MKKIFFFLTILFLGVENIAISGNFNKQDATVINSNDTLVFDLSQAVCNSGYIDIPFFILSDDTVYTIDFSLKYLLNKLSFNSIISFQSYLYPSAYFNSSDSVLRFTSFSLQQVQNDTPLAAMRFTVHTSPITISDLYSLNGYLNGSLCSIKVIGTATITPASPTTFSIGDSVCLTATGGTGYTYLWSTGSTSQTICEKSSGTYLVTVTNAGACSFASDSVNVIVNTPLPIQLIDFYLKENNEGIFLGWTTASEINNDYFTVERSGEGKNWTEITLIKGTGNSVIPVNYSTIDRSPLPGTNYYRLKQTDYDGTSMYSKIEAHFFSSQQNSFPSLIVYPNPTHNNKIYFEFIGPIKSENILVKLFNSLGLEVYSGTFQTKDAQDGKFTSSFELNSTIPEGVYSLQCTGESFQKIQKIILR